ncbi:hypothetical protein [Nocardia nova]|jgi:hypothetical protein|nr:hypothetical protein [Nocardia nova]MBF6148748.1 hypothetical protein [Nocardia nova]
MSDRASAGPQLFSHEYTAPDTTPASAMDTDLRPKFLSAHEDRQHDD